MEIEKSLRFDAGRWSLGDVDEVRRSAERRKIIDALSDATAVMSPAEIAAATGLKVDSVNDSDQLQTGTSPLSARSSRVENAEMAKKKKTTDTSRVKKGAELEVEHLTEVTDVTPKQARTLLRKHGADWQKLKDEAEDMKEED
ncbi:hypothetical protein [Mesorhizobium kowhaii]|uniref:hypothetical protein n=1 Tax=Mesorhizobium kowhaii TaxID=1300272 RepID=UPI001FE052C0|nr:hypothetical protein [Mesorhizobium kowhaii]